MRLKLKKLFIFIFVGILITYILILYGCEIEQLTLKRVVIFKVEKSKKNQIPLQLIENYKFSYVYYKKNFIYFFDSADKNFYKITKTGDPVLKIMNKSIVEFANRDYLNPLKEEKLKTKIERFFPFPEVLGIVVDNNDYIYLKVNFENPDAPFLTYYSKNQKVYFIRDQLSEDDKVYYSRGDAIRYHIYFLIFNKFGDFVGVIANSKSNPFFPYSADLIALNNGNYVIKYTIYAGNQTSETAAYENLKADTYHFLTLDKNYRMIKSLKFNKSEIPLTEVEKEDFYDLFLQNIAITNNGDILLYIAYYKTRIPMYMKLFKISNYDFRNIRLIYKKQIYFETKENGKIKKYIKSMDYFIGATDNNFYFFIRYRTETKTRLIVMDKNFKIVISRDLDTHDIVNEEQFYVGNDGIFLAYSENIKEYYILYWATDVAIRRILEREKNK